MKKSFVVLLSMLLLLGFSVSSFALHATEESEYVPGMVTSEGVQISMSGHIRLRHEFNDNLVLDESNSGNNQSKFNTRVRLKHDIRVTPNTFGVIELETAVGEDGKVGDSITWAQGASANRGSSQVFGNFGNRKVSELSIRQAYIAHQGSGLLGRTAGIKAGHMLLALGNGIFFDHSQYGDDAIILWTELGDGELSFNYILLEENDVALADDVEVYALAAEYPMDNMNVSGDITYVDGQNQSGGDFDIHLWNFGLRGDIDVAGFNLYGDVEVQTGEVDNTVGEDADFEGWALLVGGDYMIGDIKLAAEFAYGSGQDLEEKDLEGFVTILPAWEHYTFVYEARTIAATGMRGTGLTNTMYINVGAEAKPMPDLRAMLDIYWLQADEEAILGLGCTPATCSKDDDLGWEIDWKVEYDIDKNLLYYIEGGYFLPGDAYETPTGDADDAYAVRNGLILKF
ncbi:hypothetical protein EP227_02300 [bacterium]|nr:MAG: hypothetical protein EP227_02300 [bacterium]